MHLVLARYLNKRLIELHSTTKGETIGVLRRDGTYEYRQWLGFIDRVQARKLGKPVKLQVSRVGNQGEFHIDWRGLNRVGLLRATRRGPAGPPRPDWGVKVV